MTNGPWVDDILFWVFAAMSLTAALGVVLHRSIIYSALLLIMVFLSIAGLFVLNNADFLAMAQTIVYAVGLTIVLLFGVMLTAESDHKVPKLSKGHWVAYSLIVLFATGLTLTVLNKTQFGLQAMSASQITAFQVEGSTPQLGTLLFSNYGLPFELASILLLVSMIGAIILSKKTFQSADDVLGRTKYAIDTTSMPSEEAEGLLRESLALSTYQAAAIDENVEEKPAVETVGAQS